MNFKTFKWAAALTLIVTGSDGVAQQIDQSVARELGLVKTVNTPINAPMKSGVFNIALNVGKRLELVFPEQGKLDIKAKDLTKFELLNVNNSVFVTALEPLDVDTTGIFTLRQSQRIVVLNFRTVEQEVKLESRFIQPPALRDPVPSQAPELSTPVPGPKQLKGYEYDEYARLVAFAARTAYAPNRLVNAPNGVRAVPLKLKASQVQQMSRERRLKLTPLSSWVVQGLHVTVLEIENTGRDQLNLTPDILRGSFVARSFQHNRIGSAKEDRYSAAYVVSLVPFEQAIEAL